MLVVSDTDLRIITDMSDFLDFEKSKMISSAIFFALPYGLIGNCTERLSEILQGKKYIFSKFTWHETC
jgi:hypothetical protein